ncbi:hypothetical protein Tco_1306683 [Tanacetum coccineum]
MPKTSSEKKTNKSLRRMARNRVIPCSPPSTPSDSPPTTPLAPPKFSPTELLTTPKTTPPTSPHHLFESLDDLPPKTTNLPPPQPTFESIEHIANQPPPILDIMDMEPPLPPLPPHLPPFSQTLWSNDILPPLPYDTFCKHCQRTQVVVHELHDEMRFILNHILDRLNTLTHQNYL